MTVKFSKNDHEKSLLQSLWVTRTKKSKDPREKVYSLLGLLGEGVDAYPISPDYSLPTLEVYTKVVGNHIQRHSNLNFFCNFWHGSPEYPSWVPDSSVSYTRGVAYLFLHTQFETWTGETNAVINKNGKILSVDGIVLDTVAWSGINCYDRNSDKDEIFQAVEEFRGALSQKGSLDCEFIMNEKVREAFFRSLISDLVDEGFYFCRAALNSWMLVENWWNTCVSARELCYASDLDN